MLERSEGLARAAMLGNVVAIGRSLFGSDAKVRLSDWMGDTDKHYDCVRDQHWRPNRPVTKCDDLKRVPSSPATALRQRS